MTTTATPTPIERAVRDRDGAPRRVLVVGNGMTGARFAEELRQRDPDARRFAITVVGDEPHAAYNRVLLSTVVAGRISPRETRLKPAGWWAARAIDVVTGAAVVSVDVATRTATLRTPAAAAVSTARTDPQPAGRSEAVLEWDELVLATGSLPFLPPMRGDLGAAAGVAAFRTLDDCARITELAVRARSAVVIGGGLLGLEAARALLGRRLDVTVVHPADFPMERQLDAAGGAVLARVVRELGASLVLGRFVASRHAAGPTVVLDDGTELPADLVVVCAGVRPRVELAHAMGLGVNRGIVVDDRLATSVPHVHAIGECSEHRGTVPGLVQPGWDQARVLADVLAGMAGDDGATPAYAGTNVLTRLKAHDIDLTSMGVVDVDLHDPDHEVLAFADPHRGRYAKLVLRTDRLVGAILLGVGDPAGALTQLYDSGAVPPRDRLALMLGRAVSRSGPGESASLAEMPGHAVICRCNTVTKSAIVGAFREGCASVPAIAEATRATTGCGGCTAAVDGLCAWLRAAEPSPPVPPPAPATTPTEGAA